MNKKIIFVTIFLSLCLLISASAFALTDCPDKISVPYDPIKKKFDNYGGGYYGSSYLEVTDNACGWAINKTITVYAKTPSGAEIKEIPLVIIKMTDYFVDKLGGTGDNDTWMFKFGIVTPDDKSFVGAKIKEIREWGGKMVELDATETLTIPNDSSPAYKVLLEMDSDSKYNGTNLKGGQLDRLRLTPLQDLSTIIQRLNNLPTEVPESKELAERKASIAKAKALRDELPKDSPQKPTVDRAIADAETQAKELRTKEENAVATAKAKAALAAAEAAAGYDTVSVNISNLSELQSKLTAAGITNKAIDVLTTNVSEVTLDGVAISNDFVSKSGDLIVVSGLMIDKSKPSHEILIKTKVPGYNPGDVTIKITMK